MYFKINIVFSGHRNKKAKTSEDPLTAAFISIAEKVNTDIQLPAMPEPDDVDRALAVVATNVRSVNNPCNSQKISSKVYF